MRVFSLSLSLSSANKPSLPLVSGLNRGVSFAGDTRAAPLTDAQLASALDWLAPRWARHRWTPACMTDHRQIAPGRKDDLDPAEWARLIAVIAGRFPVVV